MKYPQKLIFGTDSGKISRIKRKLNIEIKAFTSFILLLLVIYFVQGNSPYAIDLENTFLPPFQLTSHLLGTDNLGRDLLARSLYGSGMSLLISLLAMTLSAVIGFSLGSIAGYFGNKFFTTWANIFSILLLILYFFYCLAILNNLSWHPYFLVYLVGLTLLLTFLLLIVNRLLKIISFFNHRVHVPVDAIILRTTELFSSVPRLILILFIASFLQSSLVMLILILGFTSWTEIARLTRAEVMRVKVLPYIEASTSIGLAPRAILMRHILPNILSNLIVAFAFGMIQMLMVESTLSFLGIGLPVDTPSLGRIIAGIRHYPNAWWMAVIPGLFLFIIILSLQHVSKRINDMNRRRGVN